MTATHTTLIDAPYLSSGVRHSNIFPQMHNKSLLSPGKFCDSKYTVKLTKTTIDIEHLHDSSMSLSGQSDRTTGMLTLDLSYSALLPKSHPDPLQANNFYELNKKREIITYLHKAAVSQVSSIWINAINAGFFTTWPGLISKLPTDINHHYQRPLAPNPPEYPINKSHSATIYSRK